MTGLKQNIYNAQCIGNVEPIEYMVPYPNLRSLVEGQNVKYGEKMVYADLGLTSDKVYRLAQQTANWLVSEGVKPKDRILMDQLPFPQCEILAFGIWTLGASLVLTGDGNLNGANKSAAPVLTITGESNYFKKIKPFSEDHNPSFKPLLQHEAMVFWNKGVGIQLSHYNLLVNANGIQHAIDLFEDQTYHINIPPNSMPWVILQTMLPLYTGAPLTSDNPDMRLGINEGDFQIRFAWDKLKDTSPPSLYVCNENTAFIAMNKMPIHLTAMDDDTSPQTITGHSVMMGYLEDALNEKVFTGNSLKIK
ncbi:MAG: hypothetical protein HN927_07705 [Candidatus Marinimicrobia bacterium]|jgi:hypothetical protein|nr:hypothetical protein [Candidatus Neomarinimicrobiota bacterium]MBT3946777.1 hypothetical protein [Candidatus Neomarinimicrobiota bacterium]MBT4064413.1 hypothetical protein [Candidatus Neomarinimicrobiota bacterium]MBT4454119.1 hypothetical protein [Candidatus Neomarinimicrobiota bacterium]MBT4737285.1 hypothetical protein [Candidatus Neomarinimicrobiota bacterium]